MHHLAPESIVGPSRSRAVGKVTLLHFTGPPVPITARITGSRVAVALALALAAAVGERRSAPPCDWFSRW
eukprot:8763434-Pyramimonas_sp.AAC.1